MARKSKSSKGSTKQSDDTDQATSEVQGDVTPASTETESVQSASDETRVEDAEVLETISASEAEAESGEENSLVETRDVDGEQGSSEVPGVIQAHAEVPDQEPVSRVVQPVTPAPSAGSGAFGMVLGGLAAGAIGFLAATFGFSGQSGSEGDFQAVLDQQSARIETLASDLAALPDAPEAQDLQPLSDQLSSVENQISEVSATLESRFGEFIEQLSGFESRISDLEARPIVATDAAGSNAVQAQLEAFRQQLEDATAEAETRIVAAQEEASRVAAEAERLSAEANAEAQRVADEAAAEAERVAEEAQKVAALATIRASLEDGTSFADALAVLGDAPDALVAVAEKGAPTLPSLREAFTDAARSAISRAQTVPEDASATDRFAAFLKRQTNARSLAPREGGDVDAILSRAEAALGAGDLSTALTEVSALPDAAQEAMSAWKASAEMRAAALDAVATFETATN